MEMYLQESEKGLAAFDQYDRGTRAEEDASLHKLEGGLDPLARELDRLDTEYQTHLKAIKGRFNVFTVLRGIGEETGLHSAWLAYLLDPQAKHDCGPLFLELFIKVLQKRGAVSDKGLRDELQELKDFNCAEAAVKKELCIKQGRIDILIDGRGSGVIAIENKIWANEQAGQLSRYAGDLASKSDKSQKAQLLLYLTPDGKQSTTADAFADSYRRISYRDHILPWLDECLRETYQYVNINQALQQYRNVVYGIAYGRLPFEEIFMTRIADLIGKHPSIIRHIDEVNVAVEELRRKCYSDFWGIVRKYIESSGITIGEMGLESGDMYWQVRKKGALGDVIPLVWHDPKGQEVYISVNPRQFTMQLNCEIDYLEKELKGRGINVERRGYWRAAMQLPNPFSNNSLSVVAWDTAKLNKMAEASAEHIKHYVNAAEAVLREFLQKPIQIEEV
jgi:hypothetical protein